MKISHSAFPSFDSEQAQNAVAQQGFALTPPLLSGPQCEQLAQALAMPHGAGRRDLLQTPPVQSLCHSLQQGGLANILHGLQAVQCSYFIKQQGCNWLVPMHQDLSVPVGGRVPHEELRGWHCKQGQWFVQPPRELMTRMLALRLHLDDCSAENGALRVLAGSHLHIDSLPTLRTFCPEVCCSAARGSLMLMRPLLWHASAKAQGQRRVLHILFGPRPPGFGLQWPEWA